MSFSDKKVKRLLSKRFVLAWMDLEGQRIAGASYAHPPSDPPPTCIRGNGEHNVQILTLTPQGEIFHVLSGYIAPEDLVEELELALDLIENLDRTSEETVEETLAARHRAFAEELEQREFAGFLGDWEKRRAVDDHLFAARHPLLPVESFKAEMLVGNATTFFGSFQGSKPKGRIGDEDAPDPSEGGKLR